jgi:hypothetical protein
MLWVASMQPAKGDRIYVEKIRNAPRFYSMRSAVIGSSRDARHAGPAHAATAVASSVALTNA